MPQNRIQFPVVTGGGYRSLAISEFQRLKTVLGNVKNSLHGFCHQICGRHFPRYLAEFCYRFKRRFDLAAMLPRLGWVAVRAPLMLHRFLKMAEGC